jgi:hypothetical protein
MWVLDLKLPAKACRARSLQSTVPRSIRREHWPERPARDSITREFANAPPEDPDWRRWAVLYALGVFYEEIWQMISGAKPTRLAKWRRDPALLVEVP